MMTDLLIHFNRQKLNPKEGACQSFLSLQLSLLTNKQYEQNCIKDSFCLDFEMS